MLSHVGLRQHVDMAPHLAGRILDLLITREDQPVRLEPIDAPLLSDHSFVVAMIGVALPDVNLARFRPVRKFF